MKKKFKSGLTTLLGRPNVGKSTLLNRLVGQHISITAHKPQTTRNQIRGIITSENYQAVVLDTPGVHLPQNELHKRIVTYAQNALVDTDLIFFMIEPLPKRNTTPLDKDKLVLKFIPEEFKKVILVINKIDLYEKEQLLKTIEIYNDQREFLETVPISAKKDKGIENLDKMFEKHLPEGIPYFPEDQFTDAPERIIAAEMIREQLMRLFQMEVPYSTAVIIESFKETDNLVTIYATIFVERTAHKKIIIGKNGSMLKKVGENSRRSIEKMLGKKLFLSLHVKISKNWLNDPKKLSEFGYEKG